MLAKVKTIRYNNIIISNKFISKELFQNIFLDKIKNPKGENKNVIYYKNYDLAWLTRLFN